MASARILALAAGAAAIALSAAIPAAAHHGWSTYTIDNFSITGTVTELRLGNPHDRLLVQSEDGEEWDVWLGPPSRNAQNGFTREVIAVGDTITAEGDRRPDRLEIKTERLTVNGEIYDIYPERIASR